MARRAIAVTVVAILIMSILAFGATAFTSAEVNREANINVVSDGSGPISFGTGGVGMTSINNGGELVIDASSLSSASGINPDASYQFGDPSADDVSSSNLTSSDYVFTLTNNDDTSHTINLSYTADNASVTANNVVFEIYRMGDSGTTTGVLATVKADGSTVSFSAAAGTTYHVVLTLDTGIDGAYIDDAGTLSGTLNVSV